MQLRSSLRHFSIINYLLLPSFFSIHLRSRRRTSFAVLAWVLDPARRFPVRIAAAGPSTTTSPGSRRWDPRKSSLPPMKRSSSVRTTAVPEDELRGWQTLNPPKTEDALPRSMMVSGVRSVSGPKPASENYQQIRSHPNTIKIDLVKYGICIMYIMSGKTDTHLHQGHGTDSNRNFLFFIFIVTPV